ncbi:hypothetical protein J1N35_037951 [Gossypium stocksii]|uniref:Uncharacterized protein n=1 Tax=Gossypium stocksii TaxID=47602 RepID=A0A9D3UL58_9ROSI|nr:hypothetical protein J1N35_037951 [Gossypium stocksii]
MKVIDEQNVLIETCAEKGKKNSKLRDMLSTLESSIAHLEESMGEMNETLEAIKRHTNELDSVKDFNIDALQAFFNTIVVKLTKKNDALKVGMIAMKEENEATVITLNIKIEELERKLVVCGVVMVRGYSTQFVFSTIKGDDEPKKASLKLCLILSSVKTKRVKENEKKST